jgi:hypothetical protein
MERPLIGQRRQTPPFSERFFEKSQGFKVGPLGPFDRFVSGKQAKNPPPTVQQVAVRHRRVIFVRYGE